MANDDGKAKSVVTGNCITFAAEIQVFIQHEFKELLRDHRRQLLPGWFLSNRGPSPGSAKTSVDL